jgi:D-tagatose-bisphosphate aldolase class II non-catalytic subunit
VRTPALGRLFPRADRAGRSGIASVCSAHPMVIEAAARLGLERGEEVLIEATCNQVNQEGGYTRMTPADFRRFAEEIADRIGLDRDALVLGGDHLGPSPWRHLSAAQALGRAEAMVEAYARAGFTKLHLDTSMACLGDPRPLAEEVVAGRAARLAAAAEAAAPVPARLAYVVGTEVPAPGGAAEAPQLEVTAAPAAVATVEHHRRAFSVLGLGGAFERAIALVVQPGVEFGNSEVEIYDRGRARELSAALPRLRGLVFEAHSTDYQPPAALAALVEDGFAILKVGPALTFALREALYALDRLAEVLLGVPEPETLRAVMERVMLAQPAHWKGHCVGSPEEQRRLRHGGYSDRVRYYWTHPDAAAAVAALFERLSHRHIPESLVDRHLGVLLPEGEAGRLAAAPREVAVAAVQRVLRRYRDACG